MGRLRELSEFKEITLSQKSIGYIMDAISAGINDANTSITDKILYLYLLRNDDSFYELVIRKLKYFSEKIENCEDNELRMFREEFINEIMPSQLNEINEYIMRKKDIKVAESEIHRVSRRVVLFYISLVKRTKGTDYYKRYTHIMVRLVETAFRKQNSSVNEMVQHGISIYKDFEMENKVLETYQGGKLSWVNELMQNAE